jgi:hypothetical protein
LMANGRTRRQPSLSLPSNQITINIPHPTAFPK